MAAEALDLPSDLCGGCRQLGTLGGFARPLLRPAGQDNIAIQGIGALLSQAAPIAVLVPIDPCHGRQT